MTGAEVKEWREARDISQRQLAKLLPMNLTTLQGWERAEPRGMPPPFMRRALANLEGELLAKAESPREGIAALGGARPATRPETLAADLSGAWSEVVADAAEAVDHLPSPFACVRDEPEHWASTESQEFDAPFTPAEVAAGMDTHELSYESDDQQPVEQEGEFEARGRGRRK
jgi:transcriptional regulator with XRE-family HTH domain